MGSGRKPANLGVLECRNTGNVLNYRLKWDKGGKKAIRHRIDSRIKGTKEAENRHLRCFSQNNPIARLPK
jgi:hypothetical protein